jgi:hypothetical protein
MLLDRRTEPYEGALLLLMLLEACHIHDDVTLVLGHNLTSDVILIFRFLDDDIRRLIVDFTEFINAAFLKPIFSMARIRALQLLLELSFCLLDP